MDAFLSGQISDQQALLNVRNLVQDGKSNPSSFQAFARLFDMLGLPKTQLQRMVDNYVASEATSTDTKSDSPDTAPLKPYRMDQLVWLGLTHDTIEALLPYATLLPVATPVNLNTASAEVLHAALPGVDLAHAQQMVSERATMHYKTVAEALKAAGVREGTTAQVDAKDFSVGSRYFAVRGRLRLADSAVQEVSLVERNGTASKVIWRQREALHTVATASLQ
jgi:general secretion pathway protein K